MSSKRPTVAELQKEIEELKRRVDAQENKPPPYVPVPYPVPVYPWGYRPYWPSPYMPWPRYELVGGSVEIMPTGPATGISVDPTTLTANTYPQFSGTMSLSWDGVSIV